MATRKKRVSQRQNEKKPMLYSQLNYRWMAGGCLLVIIGFMAMYLENEVYGPVSLYFAPVVIISGYVLVLYAILFHRDEQADPGTDG